ncbi:hypothetical protein V6N13_142937 [Hibiscus sabdariffa]|uniref:Uncharacterized protein n=1 Tax=Hibiscus sabdariffa TaxID=183260 RepID=A0ABR2FFP7_9ROSI
MEHGGHIMYAQNLAFIQKIGFLLLTKTDALWMKLLRQKSRMLGLCPTATATGMLTISNQWNDIRADVAWSVGNGDSMMMFWMPSLGT